METMYITAEDVDHVLQAINRVYPNRRNHFTEYTARNGERCLAGQVLAGLGVPVPDQFAGDCNNAPFRSLPVQSFYASAGVDFSLEAERKIQALQDKADWGVNYNEQITWGTAIAQVA